MKRRLLIILIALSYAGQIFVTIDLYQKLAQQEAAIIKLIDVIGQQQFVLEFLERGVLTLEEKLDALGASK